MTTKDAVGAVFPTHQLPNGLRIIGQPMPGLESVSVGVLVGAGPRYDEAPRETGLAHLVEMMAYQGTARRDTRAITEAFDRLGARRSSSTDLEYTWYSAVALGDQLLPLTDLLAEVVTAPGFAPNEFPKVRDRALQEIAEREDNPSRKLMDLMRRAYFGRHPYGNERLGTVDSITATPVEHLRDYWNGHYGPRNTVLAVAGKVPWDAFVARAEGAFGGWQGGPVPQAAVPSAETTTRVLLEHKESNQQHIGVVVPGLAFGDADRYALVVLSTLLGGSMNSRLFTEVREKRGLAYSVGAFPVSLASAGFLGIYAGTTPEKADQTVAVCWDELRRLERETPTTEETERAKTVFKAEVIMRSESSDARRRSIGTGWWYEGKVRTLEEIAREIDAVTAPRLRALAERLSMGRQIVLTAIGPCDEEGLLKNVR